MYQVCSCDAYMEGRNFHLEDCILHPDYHKNHPVTTVSGTTEIDAPDGWMEIKPMDMVVSLSYKENREGKFEQKKHTLVIPVPTSTHFRRMMTHLRLALIELRKMILEFHSPTSTPKVK